MTSDYVRLRENLHYLKLKEIDAQLDHILDVITGNQMSFTEGLLKLTDVEVEHRKANLINAMVKVGGFLFVKEVKDFEFDYQPSIDKAEILEFESLGFLERKENIVFLGPSGVGKTHLATAIGIAAAKHRYSTYFIKCHDLILQLNKAKIENRLEERLKHFTRYKLLIIDELGYLPIEKEESKLFFQLIDRRYESRSTIITTNINFSSWDETFKDPVIANAILDRILHHAKVVRIKGHSYRIKDHIQPKESDDQMHIDGY